MEQFDLPEGWVWRKLGEVCQFEYGKSLPKQARTDGGQHPVFGSNGQVGFHDEFLVAGPCIIVGRKGAAGEVHFSENSCWPIDTTYFIRPDNEIDLRFLFHQLKSLQLMSLDKSTAIPGLNRNDAYGKPFAFPPLPAQIALVARLEHLLGELSAGKSRLEQAAGQLKTYRQAVLKWAFEGKLTAPLSESGFSGFAGLEDAAIVNRVHSGAPLSESGFAGFEDEQDAVIVNRVHPENPANPDSDNGAAGLENEQDAAIVNRAHSGNPANPDSDKGRGGELPKGWKWVKLGEVAETCLGKMLDRAKNTGSLKPYLANINLRWFDFDFDNLPEMRFEKHEDERYGLKFGDLVICEGGEPGRAAIWKNQLPEMKIQKAIHRVRFNQTVESAYFLFYLNFIAQSKTLEQYFTGTTIKHLTGQSLKKLEFPLPPLAAQQKIIHALETRLTVCDELEKTIAAALAQSETLRQSLLKRAFEGKL